MHEPHDWLTQRQMAERLHEELGVHPQTQDHLDRLGEGWRMSAKWRALFGAVAARGDPGGLLVTLGGFVVAGADIVGAEWAGQEDLPPGDPAGSHLLTRFDLVQAGSWYDAWRGRHLPTVVAAPRCGCGRWVGGSGRRCADLG